MKSIWLIPFLCLATLKGFSAILSSNVTISETNRLYDGEDLVIDGAAVAIDGPHAFNSLLLTNGGVLTHSHCTAAETHALNLVITNDFVISVDSRIDVTGRGYLPGRTAGNTTIGAATGVSGGSYGGLGGVRGVPNSVYGNYQNPDEWGSGGGSGTGGGLIRLSAGTLWLAGQVIADGTEGLGGGSGGGISIAASLLIGGGSVRAAGGRGNGDSDSGSGGGGRIAIVAGDWSEFNPSSITAPTASGRGVSGGAGTVYLRDTVEPHGILTIDAGGTGDGWTPLGLPGTNLFSYADLVIVRGNRTLAKAEHEGLIVKFARGLRVENGAQVRIYGDINLQNANELVLSNGAQFETSGALVSSVPLTFSGVLSAARIVAPEITLTNGGVLTCPSAVAGQPNLFSIDVSGSVIVSANSRIDVSAKGYLAGRTTGNTTVGAATGGSGGSFGGLGGAGRNVVTGTIGTPNSIYGDYAFPTEPGSGGDQNSAGGGYVSITAHRVQMDGEILADGEHIGIFSGRYGGGGGSGGGIVIRAQFIDGLGMIHANGAPGMGGNNVDGGAGGGGRIVLIGENFGLFPWNNVVAKGGVNEVGSPRNGGAGTVYFRNTVESSGTLVLDAAGGGSGIIPFALSTTNPAGVADTIVVRSVGTQVRLAGSSSILNRLVVTNSGRVVVEGDLGLMPSASLELDSDGRVEVNGGFDSEGPIVLRNRAVLALSQSYTSSAPISVAGGATMRVDGNFYSRGPFSVNPAGLLEVLGEFNVVGTMFVEGGTLSATNFAAADIVLTNGGILTCPAAAGSQPYALNLDIPGSINISTNSRIDLSGKGYRSGYTRGGTSEGVPTYFSGGSYGGVGGTGYVAFSTIVGIPNSTYGDYADPEDWGTGGAAYSVSSATGGGLLRLKSQSLHLDGQILADGTAGFLVGIQPVFGGGSGGGVYLDVAEMSGNGSIRSGGGNGISVGSGFNVTFGGGGGGGRIAVYTRNYSGFTLTNITAPGGIGTGHGPKPDGSAGTVHITRGFPHTHVRTTLPTGQNGGYYSNTIDNLLLHFNKPIQTNTFLPAFSFDGQMGKGRATGITEVSNRYYLVTIPHLIENGTYTFTLEPSLLDIAGFPLDQNANGLSGEPEDTYTFALVVDTVAPGLRQHAPRGDVAGAVASLDLWFSEAIDRATFTPASITLLDPSNATVSVNSIQEVGLNRWRLSFSSQTSLGLYRILLASNITDLAGNLLSPIEEAITFHCVPVDLAISNVMLSTNQLWAGDSIAISWTGRNNSGAPMLGGWTDAVYLSRDNQWDINDLLLAKIGHSGGLASNEVYSAAATVNVPGMLPGNYHLIIRADIFNQEGETIETNNLISVGPLAVSVHSLSASGLAISGFFTPANHAHYYTVSLASGESLRLTLDGLAATGANELYVSMGGIPTRIRSDQRSVVGGQDQQILLTGPPGGGVFYVLAYGDQVSTSTSYNLRAETGPFFVNAITPNRNTQFGLVGNKGIYQPPAAVTILGAGFDRHTTVEFIRGGETRLPMSLEFFDTYTMLAHLELRSWTVGTYDVRVRKGSNSYSAPSAFTLEAGGSAQFSAGLTVPAAVRHTYPTRQTIWVEYTNGGTAAIPAPLLIVTSAPNVALTADAAIAELANRPYAPRPRGLTNSAQLIAVGSGLTPGILQPGDSGRLPIYFVGVLNAGRNVSFQLNVQRAEPSLRWNSGSAAGPESQTNVDLAFQPAAAGGVRNISPFLEFRYHPIDWPALPLAHPPSEAISQEAWDAVFYNLTSQIGGTWESYVAALANNLNHLASIHQSTTDPAKLFNFEILEAAAALNPVRTLASSVDASAPSPGFPLVFRRAFGQPILSRYRLGSLGRGWSHNWDVSVQVLTNGDALLHGPLGVDRYFRRDIYGNYSPSPGDYGSLTLAGGALRLTELNQIRWQFNTDNRLAYVEDPNANRVTCAYTSGRLDSLTHSSGKRLLFDYDNNGRLWHLTDPLAPGADDDRVTTYGYDASGEQLTTVTKPGNRVTHYTYSTNWTGLDPILHITRYYPQRRYALTSVTHPDQTHSSFQYDDRGRLLHTYADGDAQKVTIAYDDAGTVIVQDATERSTILKYGLGGQLAQVRDGEGRTVNFGYDSAFQLSQLTGPGGETYRYSRGSRGALTAIEDPLRQVNSFDYEPSFNRLCKVTDARRNGLQYGYDPRGNLTSITYADHTSETFGYDARGKMLSSTNRRGNVIHYSHKATGQLTNKHYLTSVGRVDFDYAYDDAGNLRTAIGPEGTNVMAYYPDTDRIWRINYPGGKWFEFDYDARGRRTKRTDQDGHVTGYVYDSVGRLDVMTNELGQLIVDYDYDSAGYLRRKTLGNGVYTTNAYNAAGQVVALVNRKPDHTLLSSYDYGYDDSGRRTSMRVQRGYPFPLPPGSEGADTQFYGYDPLGQLTRVEYGDGRVVHYVYDAAGNRTGVADNGVPTAYVPNTLNQYTTVGGAPYLYDADGNLTNKTESGVTTTYTYDAENRLIGVATPTDSWIYDYDSFGNRIASTHNGQTTKYVIDPTGLGNVAAELDESGNLVRRYEHGVGLLSRIDAAGNAAGYTFAAIGHASELTSPSGAVANAYAYDPFGLSLANTETIANSFEFVGEFGVMNEGNGLEFMRARFQTPMLGRFLSEDPLDMWGGSLNYYEYVGNNPIILSDPSGLAGPAPGWIPGGGGGILYPPGGGGVRVPGEPDVDWVPFPPNPEGGTSGPGKGGNGGEGGAGNGGDGNGGNAPTGDSGGHAFDGGIDGNHRGESRPAGFPEDVSPPDSPGEEAGKGESTVIFPVDPNDKVPPSGYGSAVWRTTSVPLTYTVQFENKPAATAPAQEIVITDTLDSNLDLDTFELTEIAFGDKLFLLPAGLHHYEALIPLSFTNSLTGTWCDECVWVDVQAKLDFPTRKLTLTLTARDPLTGWFPEDPRLGLLYPEDGNARGRGHVSYTIAPRTDLSSGTEIRNRAKIVFDYNDPIVTPEVLNTLDAAPPASAVVPLAAHAGPTFNVNWSGMDDPGGVGISAYDVYVSSDGTNFGAWILETNSTSSDFRGVPGQTYHFYSRARDHVGHIEGAPATPDAVVFIPTNAPVLSEITNRTVEIGNLILITNTVRGTPVELYRFSLGTPAPAGATINPTNGVLRWVPNCTQASRTHTVTVVVTDTGNPNLRDVRTFTVSTLQCIVPQLGHYVLQDGGQGRVPVNLISTVRLTNLAMTVHTDPNRLTNLRLEPIVPEICAHALVPLTNAVHAIQFSACAGASLIGTRQIAWLHFTAVTNQSSAFVSLDLDNTVGFTDAGAEVRNFSPQAGRVAVVGAEPLLEAIFTTNRRPSLILYADPGPGYVIESKTVFASGVPWSTLWQGEQPTLFQEIEPPFNPASANRTMLFRALRQGSIPNAARLEATLSSAGQIRLRLQGAPGVHYRLEAAANLGDPASWGQIWEGKLVEPTSIIDLPATGQARYFRAITGGEQ